MLTTLLVLLFVSFVCSAIIRPRQDYNISLPATTTGLEYASSCLQSKLSWANEGGSRYASDTAIVTSRVWSNSRNYPTYDTVTSLGNSSEYTLCDAWPRLIGTTSIVTHADWRPFTSINYFITTLEVSTAYTAPNCTIVKSDCDVLHTSWSSAKTAYSATISAYSSYVASAESASVEITMRRPGLSYVSPICGSPTPISHTFAVGPNTCVVNGATVQLLYWPMTRQAGDLCHGNASLATMGPTIPGKPNTVEYEGTTLTSPTVYMSLDGTWRLTSSGTTFLDHTQFLLPQMPTDVSSILGNLGGGYSSRPVNYADFEGEVPASAYTRQPRCYTHEYAPTYSTSTSLIRGFALGNVTITDSVVTYLFDEYTQYATDNLCSTIWNDYRPVLSIPPEFSTMSPVQNGSFGQCGFLFDPGAVFYDPPKALIQKTAIVEPTRPGTTIATPPSTAQPSPDPGSVPAPATPTATQRPITEIKSPSSHVASAQLPSSSTRLVVPVDTSQDAGTPGKATGEPIHTQPGTMSTSQHGAAATGIVITGSNGQQVTVVKPLPAVTSQNGAAATGIVITASSGRQATAVQALPAGPVVIGSVTLKPGQTTEYNGVGKIVVGSNGLSINGDFHPFSALDPVTTTRGAVLADHDGRIVISEQLPTPGYVVIGGATLSIGQSTSISGIGNVVVETDGLIVNGKHTPFSTLNAAGTAADSFFTVGDRTIAAHATSAVSLAPGTTLRAGGPPVSFSGHVFSMGPSGAYLIVDGTTQWATPAATPAPALVIGGTTYTANQASDFVLDGTTLTTGGVVVVDGTSISLDPAGGYVVVNGITQRISASAATTSLGRNTDGSGGVDPIGTSDASDETPALASFALPIVEGKPWTSIVVAVFCLCFLFSAPLVSLILC